MTPSPVTIPRTSRHTVRSEHVGAEFHVWIAEPGISPAGAPLGSAGRPLGSADPPRVLYVLDANLFFGTAVESTRLMSQLFGELPPTVVVGIAYPTDDFRMAGELRNRDLTPTADTGMGARPPGAPEPLLPEGERMGHAGRFLDFLTEEVQPLVAERHASELGRSILFGSSLGGLFTTYALLRRPGAFDAYVAASPALWWDDEMIFGLEGELAGKAEDVAADVFLAAGSLEEGEAVPFPARFRMLTNMRRMALQLGGRGYLSLRIESVTVEGETHTSVAAVAMTRGLRWLTGLERERTGSEGS